MNRLGKIMPKTPPRRPVEAKTMPTPVSATGKSSSWLKSQKEGKLTREEVCEMAGDFDLLFADGFDDALIGTVEIFNKCVALYDYYKVIALLMEEGCSEREAIDYFYFNVVGAFVGKKTPGFAKIFSEKGGS